MEYTIKIEKDKDGYFIWFIYGGTFVFRPYGKHNNVKHWKTESGINKFIERSHFKDAKIIKNY